LKRSIAGEVVRVSLLPEFVSAAAAVLVSYKTDSFEDSLRLHVDDGAAAIPDILRLLDAASVPLAGIELHRPSLDDVFLTKTGRSLRESAE
jgi:ABC-2 type transport system ATP-binding protein